MNKDILKARYDLAVEFFGVKSRLWSSLYMFYSPSVFCKENRKSIISEYLFWEEFTLELREAGIVYYCGIDGFLETYRKAVYSCLKNVEED